MWAGLTNILTQSLGFILAVKNEMCRLSPSLIFINLVHSIEIKSDSLFIRLVSSHWPLQKHILVDSWNK